MAIDNNPYQSPNAPNEAATHGAIPPPHWAWKWAVSAAMLAIVFSQASWLNLLALAVFGWTSAIAWPRLTIRVMRKAPIPAALLLGVLFFSGLLWPTGENGEIHRWTAHAMTILMWVAVPSGIGVLLQRKMSRHPLIAAVQSGLLFFFLAIVLESSFTGYLGPINNPDIGEETRNRFIALHQFVLPLLCGTLLVAWPFFFRERSNVAEDSSRDSGGSV